MLARMLENSLDPKGSWPTEPISRVILIAHLINLVLAIVERINQEIEAKNYERQCASYVFHTIYKINNDIHYNIHFSANLNIKLTA